MVTSVGAFWEVLVGRLLTWEALVMAMMEE